MPLYFPKPFKWLDMQSITALLAVVFFIVFSGSADAATSDKKSGKDEAKLLVSDEKGNGFQMEVRRMPMVQVLEAIGRQIGATMHYSVLPQGLVTATCAGKTLKEILECLLNRKADIIVRYSRNAVQLDGQGHVDEVWILGSRWDKTGYTGAECVAANEPGSFKLQQDGQQGKAEADQIGELLKQTKSESAQERAEAIGALLAAGRPGDSEIKAALEQALTDPDDNVRVQAISTLAHREGGGAAAAIQQAMLDDSSDVRMMAVDGISDDMALLQQAVNDSDENVRSLAALKLEELARKSQDEP